MQFAITRDHRHIFKEQGFITFDDLLKEEEIALVLHHYQKGARDSWRHNEKLKNLIFKRAYIRLVADLLHADNLRLAYTEYTDKVAPLEETSSFQTLKGALILNEQATVINTSTPFECEEGLVIAFCDRITVYVRNDNDPFTHDLKKMGYVFGDRLRDDTHPLLH